jgi:hypothetical protein
MDEQLEVMVAAQKLVLADQYKQIAAYQRTVLKLLRLFERTDVPTADIQAAMAEVRPAPSAAELVAQAVEGATHGNA